MTKIAATIVRLSASHQQRAPDQPPQHSATIFRFDRLPYFFLNCFGEAFGADQKSERAMAAAIFHLVVNRSKKDWYRQVLSGTTTFVNKTVPEETVRTFNYRA